MGRDRGTPRPGAPAEPRLTVADRLASARRARFVGRCRELDLFESALAASPPPFTVLFVHGPAGMGKSALLHAYADRARRSRAQLVIVDGHDIDPTPAAFLHACGLQDVSHELPLAGLDGGQADTRSSDGRVTSSVEDLPGALLGELRHRWPPVPVGRVEVGPVLLVDAYERLAPLDPWLRRTLLPQLPATAVVVLAGRRPPSPDWRSDPGWADLLRVAPLTGLAPDEARGYLEGAGVAAPRHREILDVARGHPLTLSLLADGSDDTDARRMLALVTDDVPSPDHRRALDACALVRATTPRHLRAALGRGDVDGVFDWLRGLPFVHEGPDGLVPHDPARDALTADARWRDPGRFRALVLTLLQALGDEIREAGPGEPPRRALVDLLFTARSHPRLRPGWDADRLHGLRPGPVGRTERDAVVRLVRDRLGDGEAGRAEHWLDRQPAAFRVDRGPGGDVDGMACWLDLTAASRDDVAADPVTRAAWAFVEAQGRPSATDLVTVGRFVVPDHSPIGAYEWLRRALTRPDLTWDVLAVPDADRWAPLLAVAGYDPVAGPVAEGEASYALFAHDWRRWPAFLAHFLDGGARRRAPAPATPAAALTRPDFDRAVRQALRDLHHPDALAGNPLTRTTLVTADGDDVGAATAGGANGSGAAGAAHGAGLAARLVEAAETLARHPRDEKLRRVLDRTYLRPTPTQEAAAELLGLPSSTYRRHLSRAVARVADHLWARHTGG